MKTKTTTLTTLVMLAACAAAFAAEGKFGGGLKPFMGEPKLESQQIYKGDRFPNVVTGGH